MEGFSLLKVILKSKDTILSAEKEKLRNSDQHVEP
jgi:hypothetical protein